MSLTLALDTALAHCQAAIVHADGAVAAASGSPAQGDAEAICYHVDAVLRQAGLGWDALSRIAVTVGPGSFTGVRVGVAFAKGAAFARAIPAVGVTTLDVLARQCGGGVMSVIDARHGSVFAHLDAPDAPGDARLPLEQARALAHDHAVRIVGQPSAIDAMGEGEAIERLDLVTLALAAAGDPADRAPRPVYLAPVDAVPQRHKALARA